MGEKVDLTVENFRKLHVSEPVKVVQNSKLPKFYVLIKESVLQKISGVENCSVFTGNTLTTMSVSV